MVSNKILIVIAITMIGLAQSTELACLSVSNASKTECNSASDFDSKCCYTSYTVDSNINNACTFFTNADYANMGNFITTTKTNNPTWTNIIIECGQDTKTTCDWQNFYGVTAITDCSNVSVTDGDCCYATYTVSGTDKKTCAALTNTEIANLEDYPKSNKVDSNWTNYKIDCGLNTAQKCLAKNIGNVASVSECNGISDDNTQCCYETYKIADVETKTCTPLTNTLFSNISEHTKSLSSTWGNYKILCGQSFINLSFLVLAIIAFLF
jgi:hypothetical protein